MSDRSHHTATSEPPTPEPRDPDRHALRARIDATLRPWVLGITPPEGTNGMMMTRAVAATARDAAAAVLPLLGAPLRSAHRVRGLITPVLTCGWAEFDAEYEAALDALLALPPAVPGVDDPSWDVGLAKEPGARPSWMETGQGWVPPDYDSLTTAPGGTVGRIARRDSRSVLVTGDGRPVRIGVVCTCSMAQRQSRPEIPFEQVYRRRDGSILDVTVGTACGACRAPTA